MFSSITFTGDQIILTAYEIKTNTAHELTGYNPFQNEIDVILQCSRVSDDENKCECLFHKEAS